MAQHGSDHEWIEISPEIYDAEILASDSQRGRLLRLYRDFPQRFPRARAEEIGALYHAATEMLQAAHLLADPETNDDALEAAQRVAKKAADVHLVPDIPIVRAKRRLKECVEQAAGLPTEALVGATMNGEPMGLSDAPFMNFACQWPDHAAKLGLEGFRAAVEGWAPAGPTNRPSKWDYLALAVKNAGLAEPSADLRTLAETLRKTCRVSEASREGPIRDALQALHAPR